LLELEDDSMRPRQMRFSNAQQGQQYVEKLLNSNHPDRVRAVPRTSKDAFYSLRDWLLVHTYLKSSKHISIEQKLLIFLHITSQPRSSYTPLISHLSLASFSRFNGGSAENAMEVSIKGRQSSVDCVCEQGLSVRSPWVVAYIATNPETS
jgi:hypothetical protein